MTGSDDSIIKWIVETYSVNEIRITGAKLFETVNGDINVYECEYLFAQNTSPRMAYIVVSESRCIRTRSLLTMSGAVDVIKGILGLEVDLSQHHLGYYMEKLRHLEFQKYLNPGDAANDVECYKLIEYLTVTI